MEYKIEGEFTGKVKNLREVADNSANRTYEGGDNSANRTSHGDVTGGDNSANRTYEGGVRGGDNSANRTTHGDVTGGHFSANRTYEGGVRGGHSSVNRTTHGDATGGENSVCMGSGTITLGQNSVGVRVNEKGEIVKIIVNTKENMEIRVENKDVLVDQEN